MTDELDRLRAYVAREVMHWHVEPGPDDRMYYCAVTGEFMMPVTDWDPLDDANHRDMMAQAMERAGWFWQMRHDVHSTHAEFWRRAEMSRRAGQQSVPCVPYGYARADSLGIAVCRAALAAVRWRQHEQEANG